MAINTPEAEKFLQYHSNPNVLDSNDLPLLKELILEYPYCQSLHFLEAKTAKATAHFDKSLAKAAAFASSRQTLYQFIHHTNNFESEIIVLEESEEENQVFEDQDTVVVQDIETPILDETIKIESKEEPEGFGNAFGVNLNNLIVSEENQEEQIEVSIEAENKPEEILVGEDEDISVEEVEIPEEVIDKNQEEHIDASVEEENRLKETLAEENIEIEAISVAETDEEAIEELIISPIETEYVAFIVEEDNYAEEDRVAEVENLANETLIVEKSISEPTEQVLQTEIIKEEIAVAEEEIVAEESTTNEISESDDIPEIETIQNIEEEEIQEQAQIEQPENAVIERKSREELIFDSPVSSDFFAFAKSEKPKTEEKPVEIVAEKSQDGNLAQYHDETLPYSFLWWLNKTRKEHAANHQPYAKAKANVIKVESNADTAHLNHQIAENIFHLRGVDEINQYQPSNFTVPFDFRRKEHHIIEKFIKEEPQIKHPAPNKIDTENKAKKSSEDSNEVVSETLAKIYAEQMLYHKALDVYKKLSLKYPEKSAYFASQIKYLELKVN